MNGWIRFWTIAILLGGSSFAIVTAIVSVKGAADLIDMIRRLNRRQ